MVWDNYCKSELAQNVVVEFETTDIKSKNWIYKFYSQYLGSLALHMVLNLSEGSLNTDQEKIFSTAEFDPISTPTTNLFSVIYHE